MVLNAIGLMLVLIGLAIVWGKWRHKDQQIWLFYTKPEAILLAVLLLITSTIGAWLSYYAGRDSVGTFVEIVNPEDKQP